MEKTKKTARNIAGGIFLVSALGGLMSGDILASVFIGLFGVSLLPSLYEKTKLGEHKHLPIILPIVLFILFVVAVPADEQQENDNVVEEVSTQATEEIVKITNLNFEETNIEIDLKETKSIMLRITPTESDTSELKFNSTNVEVAKFEKDTVKSNDNEIYVKIQPVAEGECEIYASFNGINSNKIKLVVIDKERIENEKKEAEEQARKVAEEQSKKQTQATAAPVQSTTTKKSNSSSQTTSTKKSTSTSSSTNSQSNSNNSNGKAIYETPTGKRYHYDPDCAGENAKLTTLKDAKAAGLGPCKTCVE